MLNNKDNSVNKYMLKMHKLLYNIVVKTQPQFSF